MFVQVELKENDLTVEGVKMLTIIGEGISGLERKHFKMVIPDANVVLFTYGGEEYVI